MSDQPFPITMRHAADQLGCSPTAIRLRITSGELPGAFKARTSSNRISWFLTRSDYETMLAFLEKPGGRRKRFKRRQRGTTVQYLCTGCDEWKGEDQFLNTSKPSSTWGKRTQCRPCERAKRDKWRKQNAAHVRKTSKTSYHRRRKRAVKEGARIMYEYRTHAHVDGDAVLEELHKAHPGSTLGQLALTMHVELQALKKCRGRKITLDKADRLLTAVGRQYVLQDLAPVPGLDGWSIHGDRCQNALCGTIEAPHAGLGYCDRCYGWIRKGLEPPMDSEWSMYHSRCVRCKKNDKQHECRGLCSRCLYHVRRYGNLDDYPTLYRLDKVGSGHGSVQQESKHGQVSDHRGLGYGGEGRKPSSSERDGQANGELAAPGSAVR